MSNVNANEIYSGLEEGCGAGEVVVGFDADCGRRGTGGECGVGGAAVELARRPGNAG